MDDSSYAFGSYVQITAIKFEYEENPEFDYLSEEINEASEFLESIIHIDDFTEDRIEDLVKSPLLKSIQIAEFLPDDVNKKIDSILARRPDISLRFFGFLESDGFGVGLIHQFPSLTRLEIDMNFTEWKSVPDFSGLSKLNLKAIYISMIDYYNLDFIKDLSDGIEEIGVNAYMTSGSVLFDCSWLLKYESLKKLYLEGEVGLNLNVVEDMKNLYELSLTNVPFSYDVLASCKSLRVLTLCDCSLEGIDQISNLDQVEELSLIAIEGLDNVSFINGMDSIKQLTLAQMDSLLELPDFYELSKLKKITLYNIPIDIDTVPSNIRSITTIENE